jgi:hypothetical protein
LVARSVFLFYKEIKYALALTAIPRGVRLAFFTHHPCCTTYFLPTAAKSKQKIPLEGNALHPTITSI